MSLQDYRSATHHGRGRSPRLTQPARDREPQKPRSPDTSNYIGMPDGGLCCPDVFHRLRSNSHKLFGEELTGCAARVLELATREQKSKIETWLRNHRNRKAHIQTANDHLIAVLLDYAGSKMRNKLNGFSVYALVMESENLNAIFAAQ